MGVEQLLQIQTDKGDWIVFESKTAGRQTKLILPELVGQALAALPIAKPMRWGNGDEEFARPVHWAVMLFDNEVIEHKILGVTTGRHSKGHRFHHPQEIAIQSARTYEAQLYEAYVIADFAARRDVIKAQVTQLAQPHQATVMMPDELLDEVTSIVEWPQALIAQFESEFLDVPSEALIASMQSHQKCFALKNKEGQLLPFFIAVANIASTNAQQVIAGNEKVMRARLSDAAFFFKQDKKYPLSTLCAATQQVIFQLKLGSMHAKAERIKGLMHYLSTALDFSPALAHRAALLCKCDLMTGMVGEFPELQGLMGYYYALHDGEDKQVAQALNEQYLPRFAADELPVSQLGAALSLADRMDTLVGIFAIGQKPSGVKDPFKLRRHALAVARLLISLPVQLSISTLIEETIANYEGVLSPDKTKLAELKSFILDRLQSYYQGQGMRVDIIQAVRARQDECFYDLNRRINALKLFVKMPAASALTAACKRVNNLLGHAGQQEVDAPINEQLIEQGAEATLYAQLKVISEAVEPLYQAGDYASLLKQLASLRQPLDAFFDTVMVMVEDKALKENRLALLARLQHLLQGVADISMLQLS